jgi:hypothetical protein
MGVAWKHVRHQKILQRANGIKIPKPQFAWCEDGTRHARKIDFKAGSQLGVPLVHRDLEDQAGLATAVIIEHN